MLAILATFLYNVVRAFRDSVMVAQKILDLLVWVRALVPEPIKTGSTKYIWRHGQEAKTSPSQGEITSSILVGATKLKQTLTLRLFLVFFYCLETKWIVS